MAGLRDPGTRSAYEWRGSPRRAGIAQRRRCPPGAVPSRPGSDRGRAPALPRGAFPLACPGAVVILSRPWGGSTCGCLRRVWPCGLLWAASISFRNASRDGAGARPMSACIKYRRSMDLAPNGIFFSRPASLMAGREWESMQAGAVRALPATAPGTQGAPGSAAGSGAVRTSAPMRPRPAHLP